MKTFLNNKFWKNNKGLIVGLFLMLFFRTAIADWYHVPSGSMKPNILIGDRVWVNKLAYDVKVPLTDINLYRHNEPKAGDVVVFDSKVSQNRLIKRLIAVPGDRVSMKKNRLFINGKAVDIELLEQTQEFDQFLNDREKAVYINESLVNSETENQHIIRIEPQLSQYLESFGEIIVPEDSYWVMGDNRNNSADSRVIGMVPRNELIGRAERVVVSFNSDNYYIPRNDRYWVELSK